jgi:hypothetical protein
MYTILVGLFNLNEFLINENLGIICMGWILIHLIFILKPMVNLVNQSGHDQEIKVISLVFIQRFCLNSFFR